MQRRNLKDEECFDRERHTILVVSPRGTLKYEAAPLRETRACTRTVYLQQSLSEVVCELTAVA
jgi:hypothetical protein